ncbi:MAG TPA: hypothetical protein VJK01_02560 [Candidatus Paceibacterota bacterium]
MTTITISETLIKEKELVIIPRREYEAFLRFHAKENKDQRLTVHQRKRLKESRENLAKNKYLTIHELRQKLGIKN